MESRDARVEELMQQLEAARKRCAESELGAGELRESNERFKEALEVWRTIISANGTVSCSNSGLSLKMNNRIINLWECGETDALKRIL